MWAMPIIGAIFFIILMRYLWKRRLLKPPTAPFELAFDDPLLLKAITRARDQIPMLEELFPQRPNHSYVKISLPTSGDKKAHLWGQLLAFDEGVMRFKPVNQPLGEAHLIEEELERPIADLEDWQVELPDGKIRGGYTISVMFTKAREQCDELPAEMEDQEERYLDRL